MVIVTSQLTKLSVHTTKFVIELHAESAKNDCFESLESDNFKGQWSEAILQGFACQRTEKDDIAASTFLSTELSCLLECFFCAGVMIYRKFITACLKTLRLP